MGKITGTILIIGFMLFTGCVPSLHPIYSTDDLTFDESILGTWEEEGSSETWTFTTAGKSEYKLAHRNENGLKGEFSARLVKISGHLFLDIVPSDPGFLQNKFFQDHFLKTHSFVHIRSIGPTTSLSVMESRWLKDLLTETPTAIRHERIGGEILLTASTKDTQKFLIDNLKTRDAFSPPINLTRKKTAK